MFAVKPDVHQSEGQHSPKYNTRAVYGLQSWKKYFLEKTIRRNRPTTNYAKNLTTWRGLAYPVVSCRDKWENIAGFRCDAIKIKSATIHLQ